MTKLLTIAMPCYNVEKYLDRGLSSLADDRFKNVLEVLVIDDGSMDGTASLAEKYVKSHPDIFKLISKENGGHGSAINAGIRNATGTYFRIVDGDDWVNTEGLAELLSKLAEDGPDLVVDEMCTVNMETMEKTPKPFPDFVPTDSVLPFSSICNEQDTESYISIHTTSVRTQLLKDMNIHISEGIFYVDYEYIVSSTCLAKDIIFYPVPVYCYLVGNPDQSMAAQVMANRHKQHETVLKKLLAFRESNDLAPEISEYLERKIILQIHTHYNVLLIFDGDRRRGLGRARKFRQWLESEHPDLASATASRYRKALILHYLGTDAKKLDKIMGRS